MSELKICSRCHQPKEISENFYICKGKMRSECKVCTIKKNTRYQKLHKLWRYRFVDRDTSRSYMLEYYARNKAKFAEYRRIFRERYPTYYEDYTKKRKNQNS